MKRTILALLSVALLMLAGSVMAQSDYGGTDQPADTTPTATAPSTPPAGSAVQENTTGSSSGTSMQASDPASGSTNDTATSNSRGSLPKTASDLPIVFGLGVIGAGALLALRAYRTRNAQ